MLEINEIIESHSEKNWIYKELNEMVKLKVQLPKWKSSLNRKETIKEGTLEY